MNYTYIKNPINNKFIKTNSKNGFYLIQKYLNRLNGGSLISENPINKINQIEEAKQMAIDNGLSFIILQSSRWLNHNDPLMPTNEYKLSWKNG